MESKESKQMIREFVRNLLTHKKDTRPFGDDTSLILSGRMDSIDTVELVLFLETAFGLNAWWGPLIPALFEVLFFRWLSLPKRS